MLRSLAGFIVLPLVSAAAPMLALPAVTSTHGAAGWGAIAVGQSVGVGAAVVVEMGWSLTGPQQVSAMTPAARGELFFHALRTKLIVLTLVSPLALALVWVMASGFPLAAAFSCAAMCLGGLTCNWYFIGASRPGLILLSDVLPRLAATAGGAFVLVAMHASLVWFALIMTAGYASSVVIACAIVGRGPTGGGLGMSLRATFRAQRTAVLGRGVSTIYIGLPVAIVQAVAPAAVPTFAAADRIVRFGLLMLQSVPNALQHFVGSAASDRWLHRQRMVATLVMQAALGLLAGFAAMGLIPGLANALFSNTVHVGWELSTAAACIVALTCFSRATGLCLVALDSVGSILASAVTAAVVAIVAIPLLAGAYGATGAMLGLACAEAAALGVQCVALAGAWHKPGSAQAR